MTIHWVTAFVDVPAGDFDQALAFWAEVSASTPSPRRGDGDQFLTLEPAAGTSSLRMQVHEGPARIHLDLHVDDVATERDRAIELGAVVLDEPGHVIMRSPGGLVFCFVHGTGQERLGPVLTDPVPHRIDQLCVDVPHDGFDAEIAFWDALTDWGPGRTTLPEFRSLEQPAHIPYRFLFQQLGSDDPRTEVEVHLDISCGGNSALVGAEHQRLGAGVGDRHQEWTILFDPAGLPYCVTNRQPFIADA